MTGLVAVDIGGTHARFALAGVNDGGVTALGPAMTVRTADHDGLESAWAAFAARCGEPLPRAAAIAVAGPVAGDIVRLVNNPWAFRPAQLPAALGVDRVIVVNDFEAVGHAVAQASPGDLQHICGPEAPLPTSGTVSIIGPGTGLGLAHVWRDGGDYRVQPTEGAHGDFAPTDASEDAILARLRQRFGRVSVERVVSGSGLAEIHAVLAAEAGIVPVAADEVSLWTRGLAGDDAPAVAAVARFCAILGGVAGDVALVQGGCGVVIAGGLGLRLRDVLASSGFAARFAAKGRFSAHMATIPVKLITHPQPGLFGAAAAFARKFAP